MFTRRQTLALLAAAGAVPALASCGPNASSGGEGGSGPVRIYWWGGDLRQTMTQEALDLFTAQNAEVTVEPEYSEWTGYWDKLATQTAGGDMPDLLQMDESYIDSYGARGALLDLETLTDVLDLSAMDAKVLDTGRLADGTLVGAPLGIGIFSVGVNLDLLESAGIEAPDDTAWTWEDLRETAAAVSEWGADQGVTGLDGFGQGAAELGAWARQSGQQLFPREDESLIDLEAITAFLEYAKSLIDEGAAPGVDAQIEDTGAGVEQGRFGTGRSAFHFQFHTQVQTFQSASGAAMTLLRLPARTSGDHQMVNKASMYWSIAATSDVAESAGTLMGYLLTDPEAAKVLRIERGVTAFPEVQSAIEGELDEIERICLDFARDMQAEVSPAPLVTPADAVGFGEEFTRISQQFYFGSKDAATVAQEVLTVLEGMQPSS
jgi:multiple sugar transport system substrate-binding protein